MMQKRSLNTFITAARHLVTATAAVLLLMALTACERRPLELYYDGKAQVRINVDWYSRYRQHYDHIPHGMTLMLAKDGDAFGNPEPYSNDDLYGVNLRLYPGVYKLLIFNKTINEHRDSIYMYNTNSYDRINAQAIVSETGERYSWDENVRYMQEAGEIGVAIDTFTVRPEMVDQGLVFYDYKGHYDGDTLKLTRNEVVRPMTTTLTVRLHVKNLRYMRSVEAQLTGMADGFEMTHLWRREQTGYFKLSHWRMIADNDSLTSGWLQASVRTFGLPHGKELLSQRDSTSNSILFNFTLIDNKTYTKAYNVGKLIHYLSDTIDKSGRKPVKRKEEGIDWTVFSTDDVTLELELILDENSVGEDNLPDIPYAQPTGTGAFDAVVDPWSDEQEVNVQF